MRPFIIITDSCSDLDRELRHQYSIEYIPMHLIFEGKDYDADLDWKDFPPTVFYGIMREGKRFTTAQITTAEYITTFEKHLEKGCDILSISCSSALSASVKASYTARDTLTAKYPDAKIICVDSLTACYGLGALCITASTLRQEGKTIDEVATWVEENKLTINQECTVEKLSYLKQAGRVSTMSAVFGGLLNIKPIIISDAIGQNFAIEKTKGRAASIERLAERTAEEFESVPHQAIYFGHSDCPDAVEELKKSVLNKLGDKVGKNVNIHTGYIGPIVGSTTGPGSIVVFFYGKKVTVNQPE